MDCNKVGERTLSCGFFSQSIEKIEFFFSSWTKNGDECIATSNLMSNSKIQIENKTLDFLFLPLCSSKMNKTWQTFLFDKQFFVKSAMSRCREVNPLSQPLFKDLNDDPWFSVWKSEFTPRKNKTKKKEAFCSYSAIYDQIHHQWLFSSLSPLSHRESCCSVLIGWWLPRVRKMAKSRPMKSADVPAYNSLSESTGNTLC